jgi:hypothetical protein
MFGVLMDGEVKKLSPEFGPCCWSELRVTDVDRFGGWVWSVVQGVGVSGLQEFLTRVELGENGK